MTTPFHEQPSLPTPTGTIKLPSGTWRWSALTDVRGTLVVFEHAVRHQDRMRIWLTEPEITAEVVREAAVDPIYRVWEDHDGLIWRVRTDLPPERGDRRGDLTGLLLVFSRGELERKTSLPAALGLGELTTEELAELLSDAA